MIHGKVAYIGLAIALGYGAVACSSSDNPVAPPSEAGAGGSSGSAGAGSGGKSSGGASSGGTAGATSGGAAGAAGAAGAGTEGGVPSITITDPTANQKINLAPGADPDYPVKFTVANFTLKAPGSTNCDANVCGHVHLYIDDLACNDPGPGGDGGKALPYNNAGAASPINAGFDYCSSITGSHTIKVELHNNDHTSVLVGGAKVNDSVTVTVTQNAGDGGVKDAGGQ